MKTYFIVLIIVSIIGSSIILIGFLANQTDFENNTTQYEKLEIYK